MVFPPLSETNPFTQMGSANASLIPAKINGPRSLCNARPYDAINIDSAANGTQCPTWPEVHNLLR